MPAPGAAAGAVAPTRDPLAALRDPGTVRARCRQPVVGSSVATPNYDRGDLTVVASGI